MRDIVTSDKKKSFAEIADAGDNMLHNSNMANLVAANRSIGEGLAYHHSEIERLTKLRDEITDFVQEDSNLQNTTEVSRLFKEVNEQPKGRSTRW